jgi:hypothetical protein
LKVAKSLRCSLAEQVVSLGEIAMPLRLKRCAAVLILVATCVPVRAAEVSCDYSYGSSISEDVARKLWPSGAKPTAGTCSIGLISGTIVRGDFERALIFYRKNHPFLNMFQLVSPGGDVEDAIKIGRFLRRYLVNAHSPYLLPDGRFLLLCVPKTSSV